jgi:hypothetical protein
MKKSRLLGAVCAAFISFTSMPSHAALIGALPITPGGTDYQAVYDTDLDLTWLADTKAAEGFVRSSALLNYSEALDWIAHLNSTSYLGADNWRLPSALNQDGSGPCSGNGCTDSELGHLFHVELGGAPGTWIGDTGDPIELAKFQNISETEDYWTSTFVSEATIMGFHFHGAQLTLGTQNPNIPWAVADGDVFSVSAVPIPAAAWLFVSGLLGLVGLARRKTNG